MARQRILLWNQVRFTEGQIYKTISDDVINVNLSLSLSLSLSLRACNVKCEMCNV
ncbi:MAG: hypothetical protein ACI8RD_014615 [Bacillariaceae sp.]|jgi:hypothetical protein